jgi:tetratricopeptide (TPR) repeat protein
MVLIRGIAHKDQARWDEAIASYEKALSLAPDFSPAYVNLAMCSMSKAVDQAIACYRKGACDRADRLEAHYNLADVLGIKQTEAIPKLRKSPPRPTSEAHCGLGHVRNQGRLERCSTVIEGAVDPEYARRAGLCHVANTQNGGRDADPMRCRTAFAGSWMSWNAGLTGPGARRGLQGCSSQQPFPLAYHEENNRMLLQRRTSAHD